ncbi:AIR synthase-related protein [Oceanidesulfovibrio marinus]|uniref:Phosphoribosylformylglycinamidine synthase subunit PurL n=1 Tax=Oceanidesulfovibrio marinus TaxID=370038 RepID=A0ABX6NF98_9BACT|nr:AIR synthase-related protein [Oceanidesulfovibrio marinus]QJT09301.1 phosphoribosylformylglycinamidine synthase [Oceanidesulfovibrio marinus]
MLQRIEVAMRPDRVDPMGHKTVRRIKEFLGLTVEDARVATVFTVEGLEPAEIDELIAGSALHDPVLHVASLEPVASDFDWCLEVGFKPGVTDNEGRTAKETIALALDLTQDRKKSLSVYTSKQYAVRGTLTREQAESIASGLLANELIQRTAVKSAGEWAKEPGFQAQAARVSGKADDTVVTAAISSMSDDELMAFSKEHVLALSLKEMRAIRDHYAKSEVQKDRTAAGLGSEPTDAEMECLAQTWSEHCKHKIFTAAIDYEDVESGQREQVNSLFKSYIMDSTRVIRERLGDKDFCLSVFKDNAGVFRFTEDHSLCIKVETHNSPSALDPYGGALTGIVGVNRDPMGTGIGANLVCNTDVFCFASPFHDGELPPRLLHPRRVLEGVREGVEHGGNKSGIPTINGSLVFDERYLGKPLVYCGTVGMMPMTIAGKPSHEKAAKPGDAVVMVGGRIGKDGIHGATFSSEELTEESPATAVQIGDPITQRKMYDLLMRARDAGMYSAITDNGAGGLSSSVGEMAEDPGGATLDLAKAPLKYDGLQPWEILLSEAQERMTLAVPQDKLDAFMALAEEMDVEATVLGEFTDSGYFHITYGGKPVAYLSMEFLHEGVPQMELSARWQKPAVQDAGLESLKTVGDQALMLRRMLGRLDICSKEYIVRQYDHEVKGGSVVKPMTGVEADGPSDAGVMRPLLDRQEALVLAHGICPRYSDLDTYWMMAGAIDEAVRNAVATGATIDHMVGVDNFCWCDPVQSEKTPDGEYKLAQLVRANRALAHFCMAYGVPCVSGKDSMKNDYMGGGRKISIPPTVLFTVAGVIPDSSKALTSDFKRPGDAIYLLGTTRPELGMSELAEELGLSFDSVPQVAAVEARERYRSVFQAAQAGLISGCHDLSDGGLGVALAEMAIAGRLGATIDLDMVPRAGIDAGMPAAALLYSESHSRLLVTVRPDDAPAFEKIFAGQAMARIGEVTGEGALVISQAGAKVLEQPVAELTRAWKETLNW